jgi:hypothetical protein
MPIRRHPALSVQKKILRAATGPQLVKARTLAERDMRNERLSASEQALEIAWRDLLNEEIVRRVTGSGLPADNPQSILML